MDTPVERIAEIGRRAWQKETGYRQQERVEGTFLRYKRILGGRHRARGFEAQQREAMVGCTVLNKVLALGKRSPLRSQGSRRRLRHQIGSVVEPCNNPVGRGQFVRPECRPAAQSQPRAGRIGPFPGDGSARGGQFSMWNLTVSVKIALTGIPSTIVGS